MGSPLWLLNTYWWAGGSKKMVLQICFLLQQEWCLVPEQTRRMFLAVSSLTWHLTMHFLNILNKYIQWLKNGVRSIPLFAPKAFCSSLRALWLALCITPWPCPMDRVPVPARPFLLVLSLPSLHFSHTGLCVDPWHTRHSSPRAIPSSWDTFISDTCRAWSLILLVFTQMLTDQ